MKTIKNESFAIDNQERRTAFIEFSDGSARLEEYGPHPRGTAPCASLIYSEDFAAGSEEAATCIRAARRSDSSVSA